MNLIGNESGVSILKDPFSCHHVSSLITFSVRQYDGTFSYWSVVSFINGDTKGEQRVTASSFEELLTKTKAFIETLKK
jgi:hypothetical protein